MEDTPMRRPRVDDVVRLTQAIPELALNCGEVGIVRSTWFAPSVAYQMEFNLIGNGGGKPSAADDADLPAIQRQFGDGLSKPHYIIDARATHRGVLHESPLRQNLLVVASLYHAPNAMQAWAARMEQDPKNTGKCIGSHEFVECDD